MNGIRTPDLCDTRAVLYQLSYQANWELVTLWVRNIHEDTTEFMKGRIELRKRYEDNIDQRSYMHNLSSCKIKA